MKTEDYTKIICKEFCNFYKDGKDELACETYNFLANRFTPEKLRITIQDIKTEADFSCDENIKKLICEKCEFLVDGCDFREGQGALPCGGYTILEWLIKKKII